MSGAQPDCREHPHTAFPRGVGILRGSTSEEASEESVSQEDQVEAMWPFLT